MNELFWIILFSLLSGLLSVLAAALFLILPTKYRNKAIPHFVSFATGALLGAAFLALIPHALDNPTIVDVHNIGLTILLGVLLFFVLEKFVLWRHCHSHDCEAHVHSTELSNDDAERHAAGTLIIIGDAIHNFVDGVLIAAAFLTDFHLGVVTSVAVAAHEIPQEIGDFAILLQSGYNRLSAFFYNILASLATVIGALLAYFSLASANHILPYVLALAAASFIYIAVADLIPGLHKRLQVTASIQQVVIIAVGVVVIYLVHSTLHA
ncbi:Zinc transporter, ZIP family [hydrothermal vent metagenome]|uniref:Zinc transporter, ZIP family n=1 Tax=hydrothermal vent metagenome TaxID=652676 RepID=A0A3B1AKX1_9ZZZZ